MPIPLQKPHDEFFKETFRQKDIAEAFFRHFLPKTVVEQLDFDRLQLENASFTDETLAERFSDVVYRCPVKNEKRETLLTLLLEHKSGAIKFPHLQLLKYITNVWDAQIKQKQKPGSVLPILFVQGPKGLAYKPLENYIDGANNFLRPYLPSFEYILVDMTKVPDGEIMRVQLNLLKVGLLLMKHIWEEQHILENAKEIFTLLTETLNREQGQFYAQSIFVYLFSNSDLKPQEKVQIVHAMPKNLKNIAMNTLERTFFEGVEKGKLEGKLEGEVLGIKKSIRQLLMHGYSPEQTIDLLDVPMALVLEVQQEMNEQN